MPLDIRVGFDVLLDDLNSRLRICRLQRRKSLVKSAVIQVNLEAPFSARFVLSSRPKV